MATVASLAESSKITTSLATKLAGVEGLLASFQFVGGVTGNTAEELVQLPSPAPLQTTKSTP